MKKKLTALALVIVMVAMLFTGLTMAYFTDNEEVTNVFTVGSIEIDVFENELKEDGSLDPDSEVEENLYENVVPGVAYPKNPTIRNTGDNGAYARMLVTVPYDLFMSIAGKGITDLTTVFDGHDAGLWNRADIVLDEARNTVTYVYNYNGILTPDAEVALFTSFTLPGTLTQEDLSAWNAFYIRVTGEAIQAEGFADAAAAFKELGEVAAPIEGMELALAGTADDLKAALADGADYVMLSADVGTVSIDETIEGVTIDGNGNNAKIVIGATASLKDVVIADLKTENIDNSSSYVDGGSIVVKAGAKVKNLVIENSILAGSGGRSSAVSVSEPSAEITISNCVIDGQKYGVYGSNPIAKLTIENCEIKNKSSWVVLLNAGDSVGAQLTITGNTFENCTDGIAKYLGSEIKDGGSVVFTDNTLTNCKGHDGSDAKWFTLPASAEQLTVSGNTLDGAAWTPAAAQGLGK